jgi:hypothetical protein
MHNHDWRRKLSDNTKSDSKHRGGKLSLLDAAIAVPVVLLFAILLQGAALIVADKEREFHDRKKKRERKREH